MQQLAAQVTGGMMATLCRNHPKPSLAWSALKFGTMMMTKRSSLATNSSLRRSTLERGHPFPLFELNYEQPHGQPHHQQQQLQYPPMSSGPQLQHPAMPGTKQLSPGTMKTQVDLAAASAKVDMQERMLEMSRSSHELFGICG